MKMNNECSAAIRRKQIQMTFAAFPSVICRAFFLCISLFFHFTFAFCVVESFLFEFWMNRVCVCRFRPFRPVMYYIPFGDWFVEQWRCHRLNGMYFCDRTFIVSLCKHFGHTKVCICSRVIRCIRMFYGWQFLGRLQIHTGRHGTNEPRTIWCLIEYAIAALCCVNLLKLRRHPSGWHWKIPMERDRGGGEMVSVQSTRGMEETTKTMAVARE